MFTRIKNLYYLIPPVIFLLIYCQTIFYGAVWGDDPFVIGPQTKDLHLMLKSFYDTSQYSGVHYLPMFYFQYFLVNKLFGVNAYPFSFHGYLLFAQSLVCIFSTLVINRITKNKLFSVVVVAFWIMHPVNVQVSTRILVGAGIMGLALCLAFIYLNLKVIQNNGNNKYKWLYIASGNLFFLMALMTGESYVFYPFLLYLLSFYLKGLSVFKREYLYLGVPVFIVLPLYFLLRFIACGGNIFNASVSNELMSWTEIGGIKDMLFRAIWLSPQLIVHYFKLFFWPFGLIDSKAEWYMVGDSLFSPYSLFCQFLVLFLILSIFFLYRKNPIYSIGMFWFFISIILFIQIIPLFTIVGVRYATNAVLGLMLAIFSCIFSISNVKRRKVILVLTIPILIFLVSRTMYYLPSSKDELNQWIYCAREAPLWNRPAYYAKALELGKTERRKDELPKWLNGEAFIESTDNWLKTYLDLKPGLAVEYGPMQMAYNFNATRGIFKFLFYTGQSEKLNKALNLILRIDDGRSGWYEITKFLHDVKRWEKSWEAFKIAINKAPGFKGSYNLEFVETAIQAGKTDEAEKIIQNYIQLNPQSSYPYLLAGYFYLQINRINYAIDSFRVAVRNDKLISVGEDFGYSTAAGLFLDNKLVEEARQALSIILSYDPFNESARDVLNKLNSLSYTPN